MMASKKGKGEQKLTDESASKDESGSDFCRTERVSALSNTMEAVANAMWKQFEGKFEEMAMKAGQRGAEIALKGEDFVKLREEEKREMETELETLKERLKQLERELDRNKSKTKEDDKHIEKLKNDIATLENNIKLITKEMQKVESQYQQKLQTAEQKASKAEQKQKDTQIQLQMKTCAYNVAKKKLNEYGDTPKK